MLCTLPCNLYLAELWNHFTETFLAVSHREDVLDTGEDVRDVGQVTAVVHSSLYLPLTSEDIIKGALPNLGIHCIQPLIPELSCSDHADHGQEEGDDPHGEREVAGSVAGSFTLD